MLLDLLLPVDLHDPPRLQLPAPFSRGGVCCDEFTTHFQISVTIFTIPFAPA